jgi:hypothetical protein
MNAVAAANIMFVAWVNKEVDLNALLNTFMDEIKAMLWNNSWVNIAMN